MEENGRAKTKERAVGVLKKREWYFMIPNLMKVVRDKECTLLDREAQYALIKLYIMTFFGSRGEII